MIKLFDLGKKRKEKKRNRLIINLWKLHLYIKENHDSCSRSLEKDFLAIALEIHKLKGIVENELYFFCN